MSKCSIVLPTYNGEKYLKQQIESILNQSFKDFELYIYDDQSSDNTQQLIESFCLKDKRIHFYKNAANKGFINNFIDGLKNTKEEIVFLSDQDDIWAEDKLEIMISIMDSYSEIGLLIHDNESFTTSIHNFYKSEYKFIKPRRISAKEFLKHGAYRGMSLAIRRDFLEKFFLWKLPKILIPHDWLLEILAAQNNTMYKIDVLLAFHREHEFNATNISLNKTSKISIRKGKCESKIRNYKWILVNSNNQDLIKYANINIKYYEQRLSMLNSSLKFEIIINFIRVIFYTIIHDLYKKPVFGDLYYLLFKKRTTD